MASVVFAAGCMIFNGGSAAHASALAPLTMPLSTQGVTLESVSCTSATECTAVGFYVSAALDKPIYATETAGAWGAASQVQMPVGIGGADLFGVSCTSATDCTAVGESGGSSCLMGIVACGFPIHATETSGVWGALVVDTASGAGSLSGVSCTSATDCTASGYDNNNRPIYETETAGTWGPATEIDVPGGIGGFGAVSCTSATNCTAVGYDDDNGLTQPIYATEEAGVWGAATVISEPGQPILSGVSCTSATDCTSVGSDGLIATEAAGEWTAETITSAPRGSWLFGVSCISGVDCTAVGESGGTSGVPIHATETAGVWGPATEIVSPTISGALSGVSCTSATDCTAVGSEGLWAIYPTETAGGWPKVPRSPRHVRVTPGNRALKIAWTAPASGGASITAYGVVAVGGGQPQFVCTTSHRSCIIRGLINGKVYAISVFALNQAGSSRSATKSGKPRA
jgi:Fibronectin type III domain